MVKKHKRSKKHRSNVNFGLYDSTHVWHIDDNKTKTSDKRWRRASCGAFFRPTHRISTWPVCKKCSQAIEKEFPAHQREKLREIFRSANKVLDLKPRLPKRITEQRFDPPDELPGVSR